MNSFLYILKPRNQPSFKIGKAFEDGRKSMQCEMGALSVSEHEELEAVTINGKSFNLPLDVVSELFDLHLQIAALKSAKAEPVQQDPVACDNCGGRGV